MKVLSVNVGSVTQLTFDGETVETAIFKSSLSDPCVLTPTGFQGDVQVDRKNHGGVDKAVCVYNADHYSMWEAETGKRFAAGMFGENLTVTGLYEASVRIGSVYSVGNTELQVSQPRQPCHKLARKVGDLSFSGAVIKSGLTGFYFRVLQEGSIDAEDPIEIVSEDESAPTIEYANQVMYDRRDGADGLERLLDEDALSDSWRQMLSARLR